MAVTIKANAAAFTGVTTPVYGIPTAETGMNVSDVSVEVAPEFRTELPGRSGAITAIAIGAPKRTITVKGEPTAAPTATLIAAVTVANTTTAFGASGGTQYLTRGSYTQDRQGFSTVELTIEAFAATMV